MALTTINSDGVKDDSIVNADIKSDAAIAGTKVAPDFGSQNIATTGNCGIGTASPDTLLNLEATNTSVAVNNAIRISDADTAVVANQVCGRIEFETADTGNPGVNCQIDTIYSGNGGGGELQLRTGFAGSLVDAVRVDDAGRVLIGTATEGHTDADDLTIETSSGYCGITLRSPTNQGGVIYFSDATSGTAEYDGTIVYSQNSQTMSFATGSYTRFSMNTSGNVSITDGNLVVANGHGIDFSATANTGGSGATCESELLDDYERGYFAPTVAGTTGAGTLGYAAQYGYYVKIGRIVHCWFDVTINSASGMTGVFCINNLPFTKTFLGSQGYYYEGGTFWNVADGLSNSKPVVAGYIPNNSTKFLIYSADTMGTKTTLALNTTGRVSGMVSYTPTT